MSKRPSSRSKTKPNPLLYVGYVEDDESVSSIMRKFQELEKVEREFREKQGQSQPQSQPVPTDEQAAWAESAPSEEAVPQPMDETTCPSVSTAAHDIPPPIPGAETPAVGDGLSEEQLMEVLRRTSSRVPKKTAVALHYASERALAKRKPPRPPHPKQSGRLSLPTLLATATAAGSTTPSETAPDPASTTSSPSASSAFEAERAPEAKPSDAAGSKRAMRITKAKEKRAKKHEKPDAPPVRKKVNRRELLNNIKLLQNGAQNPVFPLKRKQKTADPRLPVYQRIPPTQVYPSWALEILPFQHPESLPPGASLKRIDILSADLFQIAQQSFQGILIDAPIASSDLPVPSGMITVEQFSRIAISDQLIPFGFIFIWAEKELIPDILQVAESWKFHYVENISWVKYEANNQMAYQDSRFFRKSKLTLLVFRKEGDIELRHQRNPDVILDFIKFDPDEAQSPAIPEEKPQLIYKTVETLLPNANYVRHSNGSVQVGKLLELTWRQHPLVRPGWMTFVQTGTAAR